MYVTLDVADSPPEVFEIHILVICLPSMMMRG